MKTQTEILDNLTTTVNDQVTVNLIDAGLEPGAAYEAGHEPFNFVAEIQLYGAEPLELDPIFDQVNIDEIPWDTLQF